MADGRWKMEDGRWEMEEVRWKMELFGDKDDVSANKMLSITIRFIPQGHLTFYLRDKHEDQHIHLPSDLCHLTFYISDKYEDKYIYLPSSI
jgi:hypothetical protein